MEISPNKGWPRENNQLTFRLQTAYAEEVNGRKLWQISQQLSPKLAKRRKFPSRWRAPLARHLEDKRCWRKCVKPQAVIQRCSMHSWLLRGEWKKMHLNVTRVFLIISNYSCYLFWILNLNTIHKYLPWG